MILALRSAAVIAWGTALTAIRNRLLLVSLLFGVVLVVISVTAASVSLLERSRIILDVGLAATSVVGTLVGMSLMVLSFASDLKNRVAYTLLVRPMPRWAYVLGKYGGVLLTMNLVASIMLLATALTVWSFGAELPQVYWSCVWLAYLEMTVICAISLLFSTMTKPVLAAAYSIGLVLAGNFSKDVLHLAQRANEDGDQFGETVLRLAHALLPDLQSLSLRIEAANNLPAAENFLLHGNLYAITYSGLLLFFATLIFSRRREF